MAALLAPRGRRASQVWPCPLPDPWAAIIRSSTGSGHGPARMRPGDLRCGAQAGKRGGRFGLPVGLPAGAGYFAWATM